MTAFWSTLLSGLAILAAWIAYAWDAPRALLVFCLIAVALAIGDPGRRAWRSLRRRVLDINVLMVIAVAGALALGDYLEAAAVVWLFNAAEWLEGRSLARARRAIRSLMTLAPPRALVLRDGREHEVPLEAVRVGDTVVVRPGDRLPVDGVVIGGASAVNQAPVTGEPLPVDKTEGDDVFAGSVNGMGALEVRASRPASDSTIARIVKLVEEAQHRRAPVQTFVDRFARRYTPAVAALAVIVAVVPPLVLHAMGTAVWSEVAGEWAYRAVALLVVACPCALVISTPVAIVSALTAAARHGVLIKGGAALERLASIRCVAFDKTGTLTHGQVAVMDVRGVDGATREGVLAIAASLEARSEHPIGRAIVDEARAAGLDVSPGLEFQAIPGRGAEGRVDDGAAVVGSHRLFEERQLCTPSLHVVLEDLNTVGTTPVLVGHRGVALGVIALRDRPRDDGPAAVAALRACGVAHVVLLTGDTSVNAGAAARAAGLDRGHGDLLPEDKARLVGTLRAEFGAVAMVGDGINDAPAMAAADVGIAMGRAGTEVALETADVTLMSDDLGKLPYLVGLSRATLRNVRVNVAIALGLKLAFVALAAAGAATLWMAVLADTGASLIVTANSLRLLRVRP